MNVLHVVPDGVTEAEPGRVQAGERDERALGPPPAAAERRGTVVQVHYIVIHVRRGKHHSVVRRRHKRMNVPEQVVHDGTVDIAAHNIADRRDS